MAELHASYRPVPVAGGSRTAVSEWQKPLPPGRDLRLGREPGQADLAMPPDGQMSGWHAVVRWDKDGRGLNVRERPPNPNPVVNPILFNGKSVKDCVVPVHGQFSIGQTVFTVVPDAANPLDLPPAQEFDDHTRERSRDEIEGQAFDDPANAFTALRALGEVPRVLRLAKDEAGLYRQMVRVVVEAIPRADAAAVCVATDGETPVERREPYVRPVAEAFGRRPGEGDFVPSRRLVRRAVKSLKSCLAVWPAGKYEHVGGHDSADDLTVRPATPSDTPWAVCTPFQDGSRHALYVTGTLPGVVGATDRAVVRETGEYQKVVELVAVMIERARRSLRQGQVIAALRPMWPRGLGPLLDRPDLIDRAVRPRPVDAVVLFCDLRGSSTFAAADDARLLDDCRQVAGALNTMSGKISDKGGVVAGFQGDAVMGFWGWPDAQPDRVSRAADAALAVRRQFGEMNFSQELRCGIGLAAGRVIAGRLGSTDLAKVDVFGPTANLASRLEGLTKPFGVGILLTAAMADELATADPTGHKYPTRPLGTVRPRGMTDGVAVAELMDPHAREDDWSEPLLALWGEAVAAFTAGAWAAARATLENNFADDPAAGCLLRTMAATGHTPPPAWDGAFVPLPPPDKAAG